MVDKDKMNEWITAAKKAEGSISQEEMFSEIQKLSDAELLWLSDRWQGKGLFSDSIWNEMAVRWRTEKESYAYAAQKRKLFGEEVHKLLIKYYSEYIVQL